MKWLWRWTGVDTNPFFERWLDELGTLKVLTSLVPSLIAILLLLNFAVALRLHQPLASGPFLVLGVVWLHVRAIGLGRYQSRVDLRDRQVWPAKPLSHYWSIALPPLLEWLPFAAAAIIFPISLLITYDSSEPLRLFEAFALPLAAIGAYLFNIALYGFPRWRKFAPWLMLLITPALGFASLEIYRQLAQALGPSALSGPYHSRTSVWQLITMTTLLPLLFAPGWLLALLSTRVIVMEGFERPVWISLGKALLALGLFFSAGQALSQLLYWYVPLHVAPPESMIKTVAGATYQGDNTFFTPLADGCLIVRNNHLHELDATLFARSGSDLPQRFDEPPVSGQQLGDGVRLLFYPEGFMVVAPEEYMTYVDWPEELPNFVDGLFGLSRGSPYNSFGVKSHMLSAEEIVQIDQRDGLPDQPSLRITNIATGESPPPVPLKGLKGRPERKLIFCFPQWTTDIFVFDHENLVLHRARLDGTEVSRRRIPSLPQIFAGTDLDYPVDWCRTRELALAVDPSGNVFFAARPSGRHYRLRSSDLLIGVLHAEGGPLHTYTIRNHYVRDVEHLHACDGRLLLQTVYNNQSLSGRMHNLVLFSIPYEELGLAEPAN